VLPAPLLIGRPNIPPGRAAHAAWVVLLLPPALRCSRRVRCASTALALASLPT